jgi:predicted RNA-binding protein with RPS1 domain
MSANKRIEQIKAYGQMIDLGPDVSNLISAADVSANYVKKTVYDLKVQQIDASLG